jgi:hypothetical protein
MGVAAGQLHRRHHVVVCGVGGQRVQAGRQRLDGQHLPGQRGGAPGQLAGGGDDGKHRLAQVHQLFGGQDGVVLHDRAAVVATRDIVRREDGHHAGLGTQAVQVDAGQPSVRHR